MEQGGFKDQKLGSRFTLGLDAAENTHSHSKMLQIKVVEPWILYKKVSGPVCLSPSTPLPIELGDSKDCYLLKYYNVQKWGSRFTLGLDTAENTHYIQKCFKWRKSRSWGLSMFSNVFQELSVSPSVVNSFKVTNLCTNGIHMHGICRDARFLGSKFGIILLHPQISRWVKY